MTNFMIFWLWNGKSFGLLSKSQPSQKLNCGPNITGKVTIEEEQWPLDVDLTYKPSSLGASHGKVKPLLATRLIVEHARSFDFT